MNWGWLAMPGGTAVPESLNPALKRFYGGYTLLCVFHLCHPERGRTPESKDPYRRQHHHAAERSSHAGYTNPELALRPEHRVRLFRRSPGRANTRFILLPAAVLCLALLGSASAQIQAAGVRPALLKDVGIDQKLNAQVPLQLSFHDEHGRAVQLQQFFGRKPVILALVYYQCPMLCTEVLNGLMNSLKQVPLDMGRDFTVVTVSIDPSDRPVVAEAKQVMYAGLYGRPGALQGWRFLTGDQPQIQQLTAAVGFRYAYDAASGQFAHPSAIMVLTPEGRLARYFYGIQYPPRDLRLGLVEASAGKIGSPTDQILLLCYHYDPATGKYGLLISRMIKAAGLATVLLLGLFLGILRRSERGTPAGRRA